MTARLAQAYRDAYEAWRRFPNSTTWRARQDAELALLDRVRQHGPFRLDMIVFSLDTNKLVVIEGVRTAEEIDAEAHGPANGVPAEDDTARQFTCSG